MTEKAQSKAQGLSRLKVILHEWQELEDGCMENTTTILKKTKNPLIRLNMEIVHQDSVMHKRVQQVILDSLESKAFSVQPEEQLGDIWDTIKECDRAEKKAIDMAKQASRNCPLAIQRYLLEYLIEDEQKQEPHMGHIEDFRRSLYPYG